MSKDNIEIGDIVEFYNGSPIYQARIINIITDENGNKEYEAWNDETEGHIFYEDDIVKVIKKAG